MASLEQIQIAALQDDVSKIQAEVAGAINAFNQLSVSLHQKQKSNDDAIQEVLSQVHNDYVVLSNALDSFIRYVMSENLSDEETEGLVSHINAFLNRE